MSSGAISCSARTASVAFHAVLASTRKPSLSSRTVCANAEEEKQPVTDGHCPPRTFGCGIYDNRACAGADMAEAGIIALGKTQLELVQPGK